MNESQIEEEKTQEQETNEPIFMNEFEIVGVLAMNPLIINDENKACIRVYTCKGHRGTRANELLCIYAYNEVAKELAHYRKNALLLLRGYMSHNIPLREDGTFNNHDRKLKLILGEFHNLGDDGCRQEEAIQPTSNFYIKNRYKRYKKKW